MSYIKKWELSRYECNTTQLDVKEDNYNEIIREKNNSIDREARIHAEIERFLSEVTRVSMKPKSNRNNIHILL